MSGMRLVAIAEAIKGLFVLLAGLGALEYIHAHLDRLGAVLLKYSAIDHDHSKVLMQVLNGITDQRILWLACAVVLYASMRFIEAYGLWREQSWARWFGVISGAVYLPYEFYLLYEHFTWLKMSITTINILVVWYLASRSNSEETLRNEESQET